MKYISEYPQLIIFIVAGIVVVLGKVWEKIKPKPEPWTPQPEDFNPTDYFEPVPTAPQVPAAPHTPPKLPQSRRASPPPLPQSRGHVVPDENLQRQRRMQERLKANRATEAAAKKRRKDGPAPMVSPTKIADSLRNKRQLRRAIIMREILGPPAGLK